MKIFNSLDLKLFKRGRVCWNLFALYNGSCLNYLRFLFDQWLSFRFYYSKWLLLNNWQCFDLSNWGRLYLNLRLRYLFNCFWLILIGQWQWLGLVLNNSNWLHCLLCIFVLVHNNFGHSLLRGQWFLVNFWSGLRLVSLIFNHINLNTYCGCKILSEVILLLRVDRLLRNILLTFPKGKCLVYIINWLDCMVFDSCKNIFGG